MAARFPPSLCALLLAACSAPPPGAAGTGSVEVVSSDPAARIFAGDVELGTGSVRLRVVGAAPGASLHVEAVNPGGEVAVRAGAVAAPPASPLKTPEALPPPERPIAAPASAAAERTNPDSPPAATASRPGIDVEPADDGGSPPVPAGEPPEGPTAGTGTLDLTVRPWAEVFINGKSAGTTPLPPRELAPGIYRVRLVNRDLGAEVHRTVTIRAGETTKLRQELVGG